MKGDTEKRKGLEAPGVGLHLFCFQKLNKCSFSITSAALSVQPVCVDCGFPRGSGRSSAGESFIASAMKESSRLGHGAGEL
ncbi:Homeobox Protein Hox-C8 [Manis pentadactyla]|nr:Homeobox Protein Hox-C8 [Manis pentadactyla]